jgi:hypothetical protein
MRIVRRSAIVIICALLSVAALPMEAQSPLVRTSVSKSSVSVGEPVTLAVEVFVPTWFSGAPQFPEIKVDGAIVTRSDQTLNLVEQFDGETWAGQRREYSIIPLRDGGLTVSPFDVVVRYALDGAKPSDPTPVATEPVELTALIPPGAEGMDVFIASTRLTVEESWEPRDAELKAGDSVTRVITIRVVNVPSILLPSTGAGSAPDGVAVYASDPVTRDEGGERGSARVGTRVERVSYVFEKEGEYTFAPVAVSWWDPVAGRVKTSSTAEASFVIASNPDLAPVIPPPPPDAAPVVRADRTLRVRLFAETMRDGGVPLALNALSGVLLAWCIIRLKRRLEPVVSRRMERQRASEPAAYRELVREAERGNAQKTRSALRVWMGRAAISSETMSEALIRETDRLDRHLYGDPGCDWDTRGLVAAVAESRGRASDGKATRSALPALNPQAAE